MGVYIKGMEMPKNCMSCPFPAVGVDAYYCHCPTQDGKEYDFKYADTTPDTCPLIEIPTPHGRLIDADEFAETLKKVSIRKGYDKLFSDNILSVGDVFDAISTDLKGEGLDKYIYAPTVIEAEGSK